jgi:hypothetical protein
MVIADFNIEGITIVESETDSPLVINRYGVLPLTIIGQPVQFITRRHFQIIKACGQIDIFQFSRSTGMNVGRKFPRRP